MTYNAEIPLEFSEIDPVQNNAVNIAVNTARFSETHSVVRPAGRLRQPRLPGVYNTCYPPAVNYTPFYFLINGVPFNKTIAGASLFPAVPGRHGRAPGGSWCVWSMPVCACTCRPSWDRKRPGGLTEHRQPPPGPVTGFTLIAEDGNPMPGPPVPLRVQSDVFMAAGKTFDVMINAPASTAAPALPLYDRELSLSGNSSERDAGMLAYISINGAALPAAQEFAAAKANPDTYNALVAGTDAQRFRCIQGRDCQRR